MDKNETPAVVTENVKTTENKCRKKTANKDCGCGSENCHCGDSCHCEEGCRCSEGCNCGEKCHCGSGCHCGDKGCGCCKCGKKLLKVLAILVIFFAGMGFNEFLHCGRCPTKRAPMPPHFAQNFAMPGYSDGQGSNIIIINTDGNNGADRFMNQGNCRGRHNPEDFRGKTGKHKMHHRGAPVVDNTTPNETPVAE